MEQIPSFAFRDYPAGSETVLHKAIADVVAGKQYILGREVSSFEQAFAAYLGAAAAVGVGNGYDALVLALKAVGVGAGDEVLLPVNTFVATAHAVCQAGARPVLVEPDMHTYNITAAAAAASVTPRSKALLAVHLYGQPCDMGPLLELAGQHKLQVVEDAAQAHGATYAGAKAGTFGHVAAFSFYPTKNLGALGDAGAVVSNNTRLAGFVRKYRNYGEQQKYCHELIGVNSRLDELQAAVLGVKLPYLDAWNRERQRLAAVYLQQLQEVGDVVLPYTAPGCEHVYHIFNIRTRHRDALRSYLQAQGVGTAIHYPVPLHLQPAYRFLGYKAGSFPVAEALAATSLSLPLFPGLSEAEQQQVINAVKRFFCRK